MGAIARFYKGRPVTSVQSGSDEPASAVILHVNAWDRPGSLATLGCRLHIRAIPNGRAV